MRRRWNCEYCNAGTERIFMSVAVVNNVKCCVQRRHMWVVACQKSRLYAHGMGTWMFWIFRRRNNLKAILSISFIKKLIGSGDNICTILHICTIHQGISIHFKSSIHSRHLISLTFQYINVFPYISYQPSTPGT